MFKRNTNQQRKPFCLLKDEIIEDIERIHTNEDQRNKLYYCLDEKPPHDNHLKKLEEFLKGNVDLESISDHLLTLTQNLERLTQEICEQVDQIKTKSAQALENT